MKAAVLPLDPARRGHGVARARALRGAAHARHTVEYDDSGQIGRRYRRQDEIGTPWAFTIDEQTLEDETVTVRDRDSLAQERLPISGVAAWLDDALAARRGGLRRHDARRSRSSRSCSPLAALRRHEDRHGDADRHDDETVTVDDAGDASRPAAPCLASALTGSFAAIPGSAGAGQIVYRLRLTNQRRRPCFVTGPPGAQLLDQKGAPAADERHSPASPGRRRRRAST